MTETTRVKGSLARRVSFRRGAYHNVAWRLLRGARAALVPPFVTRVTPPLRRVLGVAAFGASRHRR
jgi:hypothetical protein